MNEKVHDVFGSQEIELKHLYISFLFYIFIYGGCVKCSALSLDCVFVLIVQQTHTFTHISDWSVSCCCSFSSLQSFVANADEP